MHRTITLLILWLLLSNLVFAQSDSIKKKISKRYTSSVPVNVDEKGQLTVDWQTAILAKNANDFKTTGRLYPVLMTTPPTPAFDPKELYKILLKSVQSEIDSLDNAKTGLADRYRELWGPVEYQQVHDRLIQIRAYLADQNYPWAAGVTEIDLIKQAIAAYKPVFTLTAKYDPLTKQLKIDVLRPDPLKSFLINYYGLALVYKQINSSVTSLKPAQLDIIRYELLPLGPALKKEKAKGTGLFCGPTPETTALMDYDKVLLSRNLDFTFDRSKDDFLPYTLWLNGGIYRLNPLTVVPLYDRNRVKLFNTLIQKKIDSQTCCDCDPDKLAALVKALNSGMSRFKISDGTTALGFKNLADVKNNLQIANEIFVPVLLDKDCKHPGFAEPYRYKWIINYNYKDRYATDCPCLKPSVLENEQVLVAVNNVPATKKVVLTSTLKTITDQSSAEAAMSDLTSGTGLSFSTAASIIGPALNQFYPAPVPTGAAISQAVQMVSTQGAVVNLSKGNQVNALATESKSLLKFTFQKSTDSIKTGKLLKMSFHVITFRYQDPITKIDTTDSITVKDRETNREVLRDYFYVTDSAEFKQTEAAINFYGEKCARSRFGMVPGKTLSQQLTDLVDGFNDMLKFNKQRLHAMQNINNAMQAHPFLVADLSPFDNSKPGLSGKPAFATVLSNWDFALGPNQNNYTVTEKAIKPPKGSALAKDADTTAVDSIRINSSYKIGKKHYLQISAGIAYTMKDYTLNSTTLTGGALVVTQNNPSVDMAVLLHYYPFGLFKLDDRFLGGKGHNFKSHFANRISVVVGLGIPQPLNNYFWGLSYDLVPGIRLTGGEHLVLHTRYQVDNNVIEDQASRVRSAGAYVSLNVDVDFVGKLFTLFK
jgi:hypothetical protein